MHRSGKEFKVENSLARQNQASMQLSKQSQPSPAEKQVAITRFLAKLGVRRQAKLAQDDYLVLAEDLSKFDLDDVEGGLDDIAKYPRREGETAFPELARLKQAVIERKLLREADEIRADEAREAKYRAEHPEEFISAAAFWADPEVRAILSKGKGMEETRGLPAPRQEAKRTISGIVMTPEQIKEAVAKERGEQ
jgi:hypothetical protein